MDQESRGSGHPVDDELERVPGRSGSVKRARQRMQAGLTSKQSGQMPETLPLQQISPKKDGSQSLSEPPRGPEDQPATTKTATTNSKSPLQDSSEGPLPAEVPSRHPQAPVIGAAISNPTATAQWPLRGEGSISNFRPNSPVSYGITGRTMPPQRPPRPSHGLPLADPSISQEHSPFRYRQGQNPALDFRSPPRPGVAQYRNNSFQRSSFHEESPPLTTSATSGSSGRESTGSSTGSIPDFPSPVLSVPPPPQTRRALGPPPSARRGASSYYSQSSFVAPIPEEQLDSAAQGTHGHGSFASSHVIPTSWGDGPPEYYLGSGFAEEDEEDLSPIDISRNKSNNGSTAVSNEESSVKDQRGIPPLVSRVAKPMAEARTIGSALSIDEKQGSNGFGGGATLLDPASSSGNVSEESIDIFAKDISTGVPSPESRSPASAAAAARVNQFLGKDRAGSEVSPTAEKGSSRRPPPLNLASSKGPEGRASSMTSLPDLIRRATRLASNLDRGRTASRLSLLDLLSPENHPSRRRSGSISDILNSFPTPSVQTPTEAPPTDRWGTPFISSPLAHGALQPENSSKESINQKSQKQCCGMSRRTFIILILVLVFLVAAAVIIPVTLIIIPRQQSAPALSIPGCRKSLPCGNGGSSIIRGNGCSCVCQNGFTGSTCGLPADESCVGTNIAGPDGSYKNATVGSSLPTLFDNAQSKFGVPLNESALLAIFSSTNLSCTSENALITFNGKSSRRRSLPLSGESMLGSLEQSSRLPPPFMSEMTAFAMPTIRLRQNTIFTSNGIIFAGQPGGSTSPIATPTLTPSFTGSASAPTSTNTGSNNNGSDAITPQVLNFARVAVLYILQETDLNTAVIAQENLQGVLFSPAAFNDSTANVGSSIQVDFGEYTVTLGNGTTVGGGKG